MKSEIIMVPRQQEAWTCGPSTLTTVGRILGYNFLELEIADILDAKPLIGTSNEKLAEWARANLPVKSVGEHTYENGLAIWNIKNAISSVGHYVVVLGIKNNIVRYYDPYWARVLEFKRDNIVFSSGDGQYIEWSINFDTPYDCYDLHLKPEQEFNPEWALRSLQKWLANNQAYDPHITTRMCPSGGGRCNCSPAEACKSL